MKHLALLDDKLLKAVNPFVEFYLPIHKGTPFSVCASKTLKGCYDLCQKFEYLRKELPSYPTLARRFSESPGAFNVIVSENLVIYKCSTNLMNLI